MALDDGAIGERKMRAPERPQLCSRCFGLQQGIFTYVAHRPSNNGNGVESGRVAKPYGASGRDPALCLPARHDPNWP